MKIYSSRRNIDNESIENYIGKDVWVKAKINWCKYYVKIISVTSDGKYLCNMVSAYMLEHGSENKHTATELYSNMYSRYKVNAWEFTLQRPIECYTSEEIVDILHGFVSED